MQKHQLESIDNDLFEPLSIKESQRVTGGAPGTWDVSWTHDVFSLGGIDIDSD